MTVPDALLADWSDSEFSMLERAVVVANHRLHETDLFTDDGLIDLIDAHPGEDFSINTMGVNPGVFDWREGDRNEVDAATLLDLVRTGQLWINCRRVLQHHPKHAAAINQIRRPDSEPADFIAFGVASLSRRHAGQHAVAHPWQQTRLGLPTARPTLRSRRSDAKSLLRKMVRGRPL